MAFIFCACVEEHKCHVPNFSTAMFEFNLRSTVIEEGMAILGGVTNSV